MILHSENWFDDIRLEVVNGDDIMLSYKNNSKVSSCMSNADRWKRTKFYSYIPKVSMLRAMQDDVLMLRTLIWEAVDAAGKVIKTLDRLYYTAYPFDYCPTALQTPSHPQIKQKFTDTWQKFADQRTSNRRLTTEVNLPEMYEEFPSVDTFKYLSKTKDTISNLPEYPAFILTDHIYGQLR
jgi:hypothetical protein